MTDDGLREMIRSNYARQLAGLGYGPDGMALRPDNNPPCVIQREQLLTGWGHGWEESWWIGDDEDPESITLEECVWIDGSMMMSGGNNADADGDYWKEHYNKQYGIRVWIGDRAPTEEERKAVAWE